MGRGWRVTPERLNEIEAEALDYREAPGPGAASVPELVAEVRRLRARLTVMANESSPGCGHRDYARRTLDGEPDPKPCPEGCGLPSMGLERCPIHEHG